jgi:mRNA interferase HigB
VKVLGRDKLEMMKRKHPTSRSPLSAWEAEVRAARWRNWADMKAAYPSASWLENGRVVFNIKGNDFRLVARVHFQLGQVLIEQAGTHADYDKWQLKKGKL